MRGYTKTMPLNIALAGNPNSGKTTLFNQLTGSTAHVGNWPGVTVERKEGRYKKSNEDICIIDLPGIYSLAPYSPEEAVARNYILNQNPHIIINIVDATNLERNLYLTSQLMECEPPVIVALNMMDVLEKNKDSVDIPALEKALGVPIVPIAASQGKGLDTLMQKAMALSNQHSQPHTVLENTVLGPGITHLHKLLQQGQVSNSLYHAIKLLENDPGTTESLSLGAGAGEIHRVCKETRSLCDGGDAEATIADQRYQYITKYCSPYLLKSREMDALTTSGKIDRIVTHRVLGIPIFLGIMFLMFHLTFTENLFFITDLPGPGAYLAGLIEQFVAWATNSMAVFLEIIGASPWAMDLVINGIFAGVGAVLGFLPLVLVLYLFISILEDTGYMARAAFLMDQLLRKFGLTGKAFVPLIMGFGCSVPAISATRTLETESDRRLAIMLIPFMSCGAKAPIYALIVPIFFPNHTDLVVTGIYLLGITVAIIAGICLKKTVFKGDTSPFILEMPPYRLPSLRGLAVPLWNKCKDFATKVGTVITTASVIIWFLANFGFDGSFGMVEANSAHSILGILGNALRFFFLPLGFASGPHGWKTVVAVFTGLVAREAVVSTMGQLYTGIEINVLESQGAATALAAAIGSSFSVPAALSLMTWCLLSTPCIAAIGAIAGEMNSRKWFWRTIAFHILTAWVVSFLVFQIGTIIVNLL